MGKCMAIRVKAGQYYYRGFNIIRVGYYPPDQKVVWVAEDNYGTEVGRAFTFESCKIEVDSYIESQK